MSKIIHARVHEIIEQVYAEIKSYGHQEQKKKLIAGIVLTGGGSQLKHLKQLVEYITGMDTRIGYPNEHLAGDSSEDIASPLYATAVGLVMNSISQNQRKAKREELSMPVAEVQTPPTATETSIEDSITEETTDVQPEEVKKERKSFIDKFAEKLKDFLDNAE